MKFISDKGSIEAWLQWLQNEKALFDPCGPSDSDERRLFGPKPDKKPKL